MYGKKMARLTKTDVRTEYTIYVVNDGKTLKLSLCSMQYIWLRYFCLFKLSIFHFQNASIACTTLFASYTNNQSMLSFDYLQHSFQSCSLVPSLQALSNFSVLLWNHSTQLVFNLIRIRNDFTIFYIWIVQSNDET